MTIIMIVVEVVEIVVVVVVVVVVALIVTISDPRVPLDGLTEGAHGRVGRGLIVYVCFLYNYVLLFFLVFFVL